MTATRTQFPTPLPAAGTSSPPIWLFALGTTVTVLGLYAAQVLLADIAREFGLSDAAVSVVPMLNLAGYAAGLFFFVPLVDVLPGRPLILGMLAADAAALMLAALSHHAALFLPASFLVGVCTSAIQMMVPVAAASFPAEERGRAVGTVMSGLMLGILLSRPLASFVAGTWGWRGFYALASFLMAGLVLLLWRRLPARRPERGPRYVALIRSMVSLLAEEPVLWRRALRQALLMTAFNLFWTAVAWRLSAAPFGLAHRGIALFALAGVGGVAAAPLAGRLGDRGLEKPLAVAAQLVAAAMLALAAWAGSQAPDASTLRLGLLAAAAVLLDAGVIADQALGRRAVNLVRPEARGRMNGLFTGLFFIGGALGAALAGPVFARGGWSAVCLLGAAFALAAMATTLAMPSHDSHTSRR